MKVNKLGKTEKARLESGKSAASGKPTWAQVPSKKLNIGSAFTPSNPKAKSFDKLKKINTKSPKIEGNAASKVQGKKLEKSKKESESDEDVSDSENQDGESSDEEAPNLVQEKKRKTVEPQKSGKKFKKDDDDDSDELDDDDDSDELDDDDDSDELDDDDDDSDELDEQSGDESDNTDGDDSDDDGSEDDTSDEETVKEHKNKAPEQKKKKDKKELSNKEKLEKKIKERGLKDVTLLNEVRSRIEERIDRTVFIKGNLQKKQGSDLKSLVPGIMHARKKFPKAGFALLEFKTVKAAQKGIKLLKGLKVDGQGLIVDKAGQRNKGERQIKADPRKLFIPNLPESTTGEHVKAAFPKAASVKIARKGRSNSVHIKFIREEDAQEAFSQKDFKINGQAVTVLFAIMTLSRNKKRKRSGKKVKNTTKKEGNEKIAMESETGSKKKDGDFVQKKVNYIKPENVDLIKSPKRKVQVVKQETIQSKPAIKKQNGDLVQKKVKYIKSENVDLIKSPKRKVQVVKQETVESKPVVKKSKNKIK